MPIKLLLLSILNYYVIIQMVIKMKYIDKLYDLIQVKETNSILDDAKRIIETTQKNAYLSVNIELIKRNWLLGYRIIEEESKYNSDETYGKSIIQNLSKELSNLYGKGFDFSSLYKYKRFCTEYPNILDSVSTKSQLALTWTHYRVLLQVEDKVAREWYEKETYENAWSVRVLQRNISSQYYYRLLKTPEKQKVKNEMMAKTNGDDYKLEFIKNPIIAEFLGISPNTDFTELELEKSIISNIQKFLIELGKGYAFVARQQHIKTEKEDYYIDLVFYNYILKCFVLIDLKTSKITHQDVGQMDMYRRMYDDLKRGEGDNPTIGIVLCSDTDEDIAKYSILNDNDGLFATKYKLYLPTEEELKREIEHQKFIFELQNNTKKLK